MAENQEDTKQREMIELEEMRPGEEGERKKRRGEKKREQ